MDVIPEPPPDWGYPECFFYIPQWKAFYCRLCWKYVDNKHIESNDHRKRLRHDRPSPRLAYKSDIERQGLRLYGYHHNGHPTKDVIYQF